MTNNNNNEQAGAQWALKRVDLREGFKRRPQLKFLLPGLVRKQIGLLSARGSTGKSMLVLQKMVSFACGIDFYGIFTGNVLDWSQNPAQNHHLKNHDIDENHVPYLFDNYDWKSENNGINIPQLKTVFVSLEDDEDTVLTRLIAMTEYFPEWAKERIMQNCYIYCPNDEWLENFRVITKNKQNQKVMSEDLNKMIELFKSFSPDIVYFDTLTILAGLSELDENSSSDMGFMLQTLKKMGIAANPDKGAAVILLHHLAKGSDASDMDASRGSTAITANARWAMSMTTMSEEEAAKRIMIDARDGSARSFDDTNIMYRKNYVQLHNTKMNYAAQQLEEKWLVRGEGGVFWHAVATLRDDTPTNTTAPKGEKPKKGRTK